MSVIRTIVLEPTRPRLPAKLVKAAREKWNAEQRYSKAFHAYWRTIPYLEDGRAWLLLDNLRGHISSRIDHDDNIKFAADEFYRLACTGESEHELPADRAYTFHDACQFTRTYGKWVGDIRDKLYCIKDLDMRGDSFGDLCDGLPLAGQKTTHMILEGKITTRADLNRCIGRIGKHWQKLVWGENYVESTLIQEAEDRLVYWTIKED